MRHTQLHSTAVPMMPAVPSAPCQNATHKHATYITQPTFQLHAINATTALNWSAKIACRAFGALSKCDTQTRNIYQSTNTQFHRHAINATKLHSTAAPAAPAVQLGETRKIKLFEKCCVVRT